MVKFWLFLGILTCLLWPELLGRTSNDSEFHAESNEPFRSQIQCVLFGEIDLMPLLKQTSPVCSGSSKTVRRTRTV